MLSHFGRWGGLILSLLAATSCNKLAAKLDEERATGGVAVSEPLSESYSSQNGLITMHYPSDFAAKVVGKNGIMLTRNLADGDAEVVTFVSVAEPITNDVNEFARVLTAAEIKELTGYVEKSRVNAQCNGAPGVEITATWKPTDDSLDFRRSCSFQRQGHGYSFAYMVPNAVAAKRRPMLDAILGAVTFAR